MDVRMGLSPKLQQRLVMTPMLQQAIQILQLSAIELQELLQKELTENPLLEETPPDEAPTPEAVGDAPAPEAPPPDAPTPEAGLTLPDDLPFSVTEILFGPPEERTLVQQEEHDETRFENFVGTTTSLADHLSEQLRLTVVEPDVNAAGEEIIGNLDEDGYLRATLEEMAEKTGLGLVGFEKALAVVQRLDPIGVGARDLRECLLIQLREQESPDPLALEILEDHFEAFRRCKYAEIARALKRDLDRVDEAVDEIAALEPKPGRRFAASDTRYVVPDVYVYKVDGEYKVELNDEAIPRLRINGYYRAMLSRAGDEAARNFVIDRLRSAQWLMKSVFQRQRTLRRVTMAIVRKQTEFLDRGLPHLRPMTLRDVAEEMLRIAEEEKDREPKQPHESTVSRVTTNKYVQTPQGLRELKFFFHSGISRQDGDDVSSVSVKKMIEDLVSEEDQAKPLSDQDITRHLKDRGLTIARRTVAKYREEIGILPSHQRRLAARKRS